MRRNLQPELSNLILDQALNPTMAFMHAAFCFLGTKEEGNNSGEIVELFQKTIGDAKEEAWCLSFIQSCIAFAEEITITESKLKATEWVHELLEAHKSELFNNPIPGAIALWRDPSTLFGHAAIVIASVKGAFYTIEGNTSSGVEGSQRDGRGVYIRQRTIARIGPMYFVGFLKPF